MDDRLKHRNNIIFALKIHFQGGLGGLVPSQRSRNIHFMRTETHEFHCLAGYHEKKINMCS